MTNSERICEGLGKLYFFKEMVKSNLVYITENNEEKELADVLMRVDNYILAIQIKEKTTSESSDISKWLNNKVYKVAKNQSKTTCKEILTTINFKEKNNDDILENIDKCSVIPLIIFDIGNIEVPYDRIYRSSTDDLIICIFNLRDFKEVCEELISPMEMVRYLIRRISYVGSPLLTCEHGDKMIIGKSSSEKAMLTFYSEEYELGEFKDIRKDLLTFNTYLTLFEEHCITNKDQYKQFIKFLSKFYTIKIHYFIERLQLIIKKGFNKELYWKSYMHDENEGILFISLPQDKYDLSFIEFLSNIFMYHFNLNKALTIITYSIDKEHYELDFALSNYEDSNIDSYDKNMINDFVKEWDSRDKICETRL